MELRWSPITPRGRGLGYHGIAAPRGVRTLTWYGIIIQASVHCAAGRRPRRSTSYELLRLSLSASWLRCGHFLGHMRARFSADFLFLCSLRWLACCYCGSVGSSTASDGSLCFCGRQDALITPIRRPRAPAPRSSSTPGASVFAARITTSKITNRQQHLSMPQGIQVSTENTRSRYRVP